VRAIRALFICPTLDVGGAERQWATLLPMLRERGISVQVMALNVQGRFFHELQAAGIETSYAAVRNRFDLVRLVRTVRSVRSTPDVVVSQSIDAHVVGRAIARRLRCRHIHVEHAGPGFGRKVHHGVLYRLVASSADAVVAVSRSQLATLAELGYPAHLVRIIPNGVEPPTVTRGRAAVRSELGLSDEDFAVLLLATLRPEKRATLFARVIDRAHQVEPAIRGIVAGGGPDLEPMRELAASLNGALSVLGYREDVGDLLVGADLVCLTSAVEAAPLSLLESMAMERPVLAFRVGGIEELVDASSGVLVEDEAGFGSALVALARDRQLASKLGRGARGRYEHIYTPERMADAYAELLRSVAVAADSR
jgi:glycosyltransferase involved in cell wall biosynthesis